MGKEKLKSLLTAFSPNGDCLTILSADGCVKAWNTNNGSQIAEWKEKDQNSSVSFSCIACTFIGKMRRKEQGTCLVALGKDSGDVSVVNVSLGKVLWEITGRYPSGIASLSFKNGADTLHILGADGVTSELKYENGEVSTSGEFKIFKKSVASAAFLSDDKIIAAVGHRIRVVNLKGHEEVMKLSSSLDSVRCVSSSGDAKFIVVSGDGEKCLQVLKCDFGTGDVNSHVLSLKHRPLRLDCRNGLEDGLIVLSVSEAGVAYVWNLKSISDDVSPTKISVKDDSSEQDSVPSERAKRDCMPIIAARIHALEATGLVKVMISYGPFVAPQFAVVDIAIPGQDIVIAAAHIALQENGVPSEEGASKQREKSKKKRAASYLESATGVALIDDGRGDAQDNHIQIPDDLNEPTMGEKLANLNLGEVNESKSPLDVKFSPPANPPSADSVHVLLKQALHADDRALLIDCLFRQDEKVIRNSVSALNPSDVLKFLQSLLSIIQSRGAVLVCAIPWLRSLLLQHASGLMSQEASLSTLNTIYQLIESRVSNFNQTLQLSSSLDLLYGGSLDLGLDENDDTVTPAFYEDKDESEEDVSAEAMEIESDDTGKEPETGSEISDFEEME